MIRSRLTIKSAWPWLLIIMVMVLSAALTSCGNDTPAATPTPTKTPRPAAAVATAMPAPTQAPTQTPAVAAAPQPEPTAAAIATPAATEAASPAPTQAEPSPTARPAAPTPGIKADSSMTSPDFGVQAFLWWKPEVADRDLQLVQEAGFKWVKQLVSWQDVEGAGKGQYDWTNLDRIVGQAEQHGLKLIVRVSQDPDRPFWAGNPPENAGHFADFLTAMASRYHQGAGEHDSGV